MTDTQRAVLETFFAQTLAEGTLTFTARNPVTGEDAATWQFAAPPSFEHRYGTAAMTTHYQVGLVLDLLP